MLDRFRVAWTLPRRLAELGVAPAEVLRRGRLPATLLDGDRIEVTTAELFALYRAIAATSPRPAIGLELGTASRVEHYDPIALAGLYARSFRDALERVARYKALVCPERIQVTERGGLATVRYVWLHGSEPEPGVLVDHCFAWLVEIGRRGTGGALVPRRVELRRPKADAAVYEAHFRCPVRFGARHDALVFASSALDEPFVSHNPSSSGRSPPSSTPSSPRAPRR